MPFYACIRTGDTVHFTIDRNMASTSLIPKMAMLQQCHKMMLLRISPLIYGFTLDILSIKALHTI